MYLLITVEFFRSILKMPRYLLPISLSIVRFVIFTGTFLQIVSMTYM